MLKVYGVLGVVLLLGCSALTDFAIDSLAGDKGGIDTEIVVGDKTQVLGINQDVKASTVGKVVGNNATDIAAATDVQVNNTNIPGWFIMALLGLTIVGWVLPTPMTMWNNWRNKQ